MSKRKNIIGRCRICGREGKLSFEHVPPQKAYNQEITVEYKLESWVRKERIKGKQRQGGIGEYTLCEQCNPDTGSWYGNEYVKWASIGFDVLNTLGRNPDILSGKSTLAVVLKSVYPLRFLKQVITCLFSVISISPNSNFADNNPDLVRFVLDRYETDLPETYQFFLKLYRKPSKLRRIPIAGKLTVSYDKDKSGNIISSTIRSQPPSIFSEIAHPPFALVMTYGTPFPGATNITHFINFKYDECVDLVLPLNIGLGLTPYPGSYQ
jgi:hypothetical protein